MVKMICPIKAVKGSGKTFINIPKDCPKNCMYLKRQTCTHPDRPQSIN
jgi:hypothetical protein